MANEASMGESTETENAEALDSREADPVQKSGPQSEQDVRDGAMDGDAAAGEESAIGEGSAADSDSADSKEVDAEETDTEEMDKAEMDKAEGEGDEPDEEALWADDGDLQNVGSPALDESEDETGREVAPLELIEEGEEEAAPSEEDREGEMDWYILKVQSNREESISASLRRRVNVAGLESFFGDVIVPVEMVTEFKGGKKKITKRKLYPGYIVVRMVINDETWFLVRETSGIGDFTGSIGRPTPMLAHEVNKIVQKEEETEGEEAPLLIGVKPGERVKITEGTFENFEGEVDTIDQSNGRVTIMINIFGRSVPTELEYWQIETI